MELSGEEGGVLVCPFMPELFIGEIESVLLLFKLGEISLESGNWSEKRVTEGCCKERTCADSDTKGLEGGLGCVGSNPWKVSGAERDVKGDANERSRTSGSLADFVERFLHLKKLLPEVLFRGTIS